MATTIENAASTATDQGKAVFGEMNDRAKGAMEKGARLFEDANAFGKGNIEAMVESSKIAARSSEPTSACFSSVISASIASLA